MKLNLKLIYAQGEWISINHIKKIYIDRYPDRDMYPDNWYVEVLDFDNKKYIATDPLSEKDARKRLGKIALSINHGFDAFDYYNSV